MKLGEILILKGLIDEQQLEQALKYQFEKPGKKLGEIIMELGYINPEQLVNILNELQ